MVSVHSSAKGLIVLLCIVLLEWFIPQASFAYVSTITASGTPIKWPLPIQLRFAGNPTNQSGITSQFFFDSVIQGLNRWNAATGGQIKYDYWQGTDSKYYPPNSEFNGTSSIYFLSNATTPPVVARNVLGVTQVWYNIQSGTIFETDIVLNDRDFNFTNNPTDTSGYGAAALKSPSKGRKPNVYIQNVITHEMGHAMGLSHSAGLQSSMLFLESPEQAHLGCDEQVAMRALYPLRSEVPSLGSIVGTVFSETNRPVFGAHVVAISESRNTVLATAITRSSGQFTMQGLEPGNYFLLIEPFYAGPSVLPDYYSKINSQICGPGTDFNRSFLTDPSGFRLLPVAVHSGASTLAPNLTAKCRDLNSAGPSSVLNSTNQERFAVVDKLGDQSNIYSLSNISGHLEIHLLAYGLYSPIQPLITLLDKMGNEVSVNLTEPIYSGDSGYVNRDSSLSAEGLPQGDYFLKISGNLLQAQAYPGGTVSLDSTPFIVISGSLNQEPVIQSRLFPSNARCRQEENYPPYMSPPGLPIQTQAETPPAGIGFCARIRDHSDQNDSFKPGKMSVSVLIGWSIPWLFIILIQTTFKAVNRLRSRPKTVNLKG